VGGLHQGQQQQGAVVMGGLRERVVAVESLIGLADALRAARVALTEALPHSMAKELEGYYGRTVDATADLKDAVFRGAACQMLRVRGDGCCGASRCVIVQALQHEVKCLHSMFSVEAFFPFKEASVSSSPCALLWRLSCLHSGVLAVGFPSFTTSTTKSRTGASTNQAFTCIPLPVQNGLLLTSFRASSPDCTQRSAARRHVLAGFLQHCKLSDVCSR